MKNKLISVIIPSYNHGKFLEKAIDSVLNQTYSNFELIILDDNSTDNSKKIINSYNDKRIKKYFSDINRGGVETLNQLIDMANGDYIALLNSDDFWENDKLEKQFQYLENNLDVAVCFTWADFVDEKNKTIYDEKVVLLDLFQKENRSQAEWLKYFFDYGNCLCHPSMMIRKEVYDNVGDYNNLYRQIPDFEMWIRIIKKYKIHIIQENLTHFRIITTGVRNTSYMSEKNTNAMNYEMFAVRKNFFDGCDNKLIYKAFKDKIINEKCINNDIMMRMETALMQYNCKLYNQIGKFIAYNEIFELLSNKKNQNLIKEEYNFSFLELQKLSESIVPLDVQYFEPIVIEKIPANIENSRIYRLSNKIYSSKVYNALLRLRLKFRHLIGK